MFLKRKSNAFQLRFTNKTQVSYENQVKLTYCWICLIAMFPRYLIVQGSICICLFFFHNVPHIFISFAARLEKNGRCMNGLNLIPLRFYGVLMTTEVDHINSFKWHIKKWFSTLAMESNHLRDLIIKIPIPSPRPEPAEARAFTFYTYTCTFYYK